MPDHLHDAARCPCCELVLPDVYRRRWKHQAKVGAWHLIADGPELTARLPGIAHFLTILGYRLGPAGSPAHYSRPLYWEFDADDPVHALEDLRRVVERLGVEYDCPLEALHIWYSGGRGFHVTVPPIVIGAEAGHPQLPRVYATMITKLFPPHIAPTLDRSIYNMGQGRMWRLANRRRSDTGRYKVPVAIQEVLHQPSAALDALTIHPRKGRFWPTEQALASCPALVQCYHEAMAILGDGASQPTLVHEDTRIPAGRRNATLTAIAGAMRRVGASQDAMVSALMTENRLRCDPPLSDAEITRSAARIARYRPAGPGTAAPRTKQVDHMTRGGIRTIAAQEVLTWRR